MDSSAMRLPWSGPDVAGRSGRKVGRGPATPVWTVVRGRRPSSSVRALRGRSSAHRGRLVLSPSRRALGGRRLDRSEAADARVAPARVRRRPTSRSAASEADPRSRTTEHR
ncbi:hypothetical protein FTX61_11540 [Nitriliruptoraceae bacterium ZYF776]|nr:hypothetical protein [Profundirhabdus halotolerans]